MKIIVASHTYIVDLNCEKLRELSQLESDIQVIALVPKRWRPGGVQNKIIESKFKDEGNFKIVPVGNFSENNQGLLTFQPEIVKLLKEFKPDIIHIQKGHPWFEKRCPQVPGLCGQPFDQLPEALQGGLVGVDQRPGQQADQT